MKNNFRQSGAVLIVSLVLMIASTLIVLYTSKVVVTEHIVSGNDYKSSQALHAADAGVEMAVAALKSPSQATLLLSDSNSDGWLLDESTNKVSGDLVAGITSYFVSITNLNESDFELLSLESIGCADGCSPCSAACPVKKIVRQTILASAVLSDPPPAPLIAHGFVDIGGNVDVTNLETDTAIQAGGGIGISGSASTTTSDGTSGAPTYPSVSENDPTISSLTPDQFFDNFFSTTRGDLSDIATHFDCGGNSSTCNAVMSGAAGDVMWSDGDVHLNGNSIFGSVEEPIILYVDGNLVINGNVEFYGLIYVAGDWNNSGGGSATIHGAAISEGNFSGVGTPNPTYNSQVLSNLMNNISVTPVAGSWID